MDKLLWDKIKSASISSIKDPGKNNTPLPKTVSEKYPEIYVFRHGETYDNANKVFSGWRDSTLTITGIKQAEILGEKLKHKHIDLCITSPLARSKETSRIALRYHAGMHFEEDQRIIERNYGDLQGTSKEKLMIENQDLAIKYRRSYDFPPPHGESLKMVEKRAFDFCEELVERIKRDNITVAISCHGNSMRAIRKYFEHLSIVEELTLENPLAQDYAEYVIRSPRTKRADPYFNRRQLNHLVIPNSKIVWT